MLPVIKICHPWLAHSPCCPWEDALTWVSLKCSHSQEERWWHGLLYASRALEKLKAHNFDQKAPRYTIATNAGAEGAVVVGKLLEQENLEFGYDAAKGEYVDMIKAGIIDPLKVIRTALLDAASVSSLLATTEAVVAEVPKVERAGAIPRAGGGMGGGLHY